MTPELGQKVMMIAQGLVGSHYINGACGATPGCNDGVPYRSGGVMLIADESHLDPKLNIGNKQKNLAVNAATMTVNTYAVCAGNHKVLPLGGPVAETDPALKTYLDSLKGKPPASWPKHNGTFTPRRTFGPGQTGKDGHGKLVWGQSCEGIRHFDCVGFIGYCYWKASGLLMQLDISAWRTPSPGRQVYDLRAQERPAALMDGDILVKADEHIGFVSKAGVIVEAQDTDLGVRSTPGFSLAGPGAWTHLVRIGGGGHAEMAWPTGWWRVWDGGTWYYYLGPDGVAKSSRQVPYDTRSPPAKAHNTGTWKRTGDRTLVVTWKQIVGASMPCVETFYNANQGCQQMNANSNLYSPLVATLLV